MVVGAVRNVARRRRLAALTWLGQLLLHPCFQSGHAHTTPQVGKQKRPVATHLASIALHDLERCSNVRSQIYLIDNQQIGTDDSRAAFAWNFVASGYVDDVDR